MEKTHQQLVELAEGLKLSFNEKAANYENLHRALLTGLLSFIANKTDERNTFYGGTSAESQSISCQYTA